MNTKGIIRNISALVVAALAALTILAAPVWAEEEKPTGDFTVSALNKYVWRGYELSRDSIVIQPSATIGYKGFAVNLWGNLDTEPYSPVSNVNYTGTWNETDLTVSYTKSLGLFNVGGGYIYYGTASMNKDAPDRNDSQEIFATVSLNTLLTPTLTAYKEIDHYRNWYFLLGVSQTFEMSKMVGLKLAATASYLMSTDAETYPKFDAKALPTTEKFSNFHDATIAVSLPIKPANYITITPTASYIFPISGDAKDEMKGFGMEATANPADRKSAFFTAGIAASFAF